MAVSATGDRRQSVTDSVERESARALEQYLPLLSTDAAILDFAHASSPAQALSTAREWAERGHISRLACATSVDRLGIPNYYAVRPSSRHKDTVIAGGKGVTDSAAVLSALFEAVERWAAETVAAPPILASRVELTTSVPSVATAAPRTLPSHATIPWVVGIDLLTEKACLVPLQRTIFPMPSGMPWLQGLGCDTTGLAAGTHPCEAVCSGLLELIERDATSRMTINTASRVALDSLPAAAAELTNRFADAGVDLRISWLRSDTGVPVFHAFSRDDHLGLSQFFCSGAGAHPQPLVALTRALTEVAQSRSGYITTIRDDVSEMAESLARVPYERRRSDLAGWFDATQTVEFTAARGPTTPHTFRLMLRDLVERIRGSCSPTVVAWVPLYCDASLHACRVYCPELRNPSVDLD